MQFILNTLISAIVIASAVELSNRSSFLSSLLVSLPLTSVLALSMLYFKTSDVTKVSELSLGIFWLVLPSLGFFLLLPVLLKFGLNFWASLFISIISLGIFYFFYSLFLRRFGFL